MKFIIGFVVVVACVLGGYVLADGHLEVLWQPLEFLIIFGAGIGAFIISNPSSVIKGVLGTLSKLIKGSKYTQESYLELLSVQYAIFKLAKSKGDLALESHIENPHESSLSWVCGGSSRAGIHVRLFAHADAGHIESP